MTNHKNNPAQKENIHAFTTADILKSFEEVEKTWMKQFEAVLIKKS